MRYFFIMILPVLLAVACKSKKQPPQASDEVYYTCPMHPDVKENKPGKCPVCKMELTPVKKSTMKDSTPQAAGEIELTEQQVRLGNLRVDTIRRGAIGNQMILTATLNFDLSKTNAVSARVAGRIERLYFKNAGDYIGKGAKLFDIYSEALNNAKQEYVLALEKQSKLDNAIIDFNQLVQAAKTKLLLWGMNEVEVAELAKSRKASPLTSFYSNAAGFITALDVKEGDYVMEGGTVVRLADVSTLWAEAQVYASQLSSIAQNDPVTIQFPDVNGKEIRGRIEFANPEINPGSRINLIRAVIPNAGNLLKPGMQAYMVIMNRQHNTLTLPIDAVIRDSKGAFVWTQAAGNKFKYKMVETGAESGDRIEIRAGLEPGDRVVVSGAYLLNSEYIFTTGSNPMAGMDMGDMEM